MRLLSRLAHFAEHRIQGRDFAVLSTVLDDYSRYIIAWKLCSTMRAEDVTDTLDMALAASGCNHANVLHRPRLLSDNVLGWEAAAGKGQQVSLRRA